MNKLRFDNEPSDKKILVSALGWIGVIFIFVLIVAVAYLPNRSVSQAKLDVTARTEIRDKVHSEQQRLVSTYGWVNQNEGIVRIPVERAMQLVVEELRAEQEPQPEPTL